MDGLNGMEDDGTDIDVFVVLPDEMEMAVSAVSEEAEEEYAGKTEGGLEDKVYP